MNNEFMTLKIDYLVLFDAYMIHALRNETET